MESVPRHRCLVYEGSPERYLPVLATSLTQMLERGCRCLYLHSPQMVEGMRKQLAAQGIDVEKETRRGSLVLTSAQSHLVNGRFDADLMMRMLSDSLQQALNDGYKGFWATGDMSWEFGPAGDFSELLEYEWQLDEFFQSHPELGGICQYHADTLPREVMRHGLLAHPSIFINETLSLLNPHYLHPGSSPKPEAKKEKIPELDLSLNRLLQLEFAI